MRNQRIMLKLSASEDRVSLRTVSRDFCSPQRFIILESELRELEEKRYIIVSDIRSFAELRLEKAGTVGDGEILSVTFTWLSDMGRGKVSGTEEALRLSFRRFREGMEKSRSLDGAGVGMLSLKDRGVPKIEFQSRKHLAEVARIQTLRRKLGKFLDSHFAWKGGGRIVVSDDFVPYSFFFREERDNGTGLCGGIILHGQEDLKKAYYGMHT